MYNFFFYFLSVLFNVILFLIYTCSTFSFLKIFLIDLRCEKSAFLLFPVLSISNSELFLVFSLSSAFLVGGYPQMPAELLPIHIEE